MMVARFAGILKIRRLAAAAMVAAGIAGGIAISGRAQDLGKLNTPDTPIVLKALGSFYVGGRAVDRTAAEIGIYGGGSLTVDQMYVQYMIPQNATKPAVVMIHGGTLSGKSFETTPDGRMGWYEYFARKGYPSYVVDQVGRGRSGFDYASFNNVRNGQAAPSTQPNVRRVADDVAWVRFRFGPRSGVRFDDSQFPTESAEQFAKQTVPDMSMSPPAPGDANYSGLSELARKLGGAVLIGHSQSGPFPFETALLNPQGIKALVAIEPGGCNSGGYSREQIAKLARFPILIVFGDHLDTPQKYGSSWLPYFQDCQAFVARINAADGRARMLHTTDHGIRGNSHMMMQDKNNLQIADMIMKWIERQ